MDFYALSVHLLARVRYTMGALVTGGARYTRRGRVTQAVRHTFQTMGFWTAEVHYLAAGF